MIKDEYGNPKFYGMYRGVVVDNTDPLGAGRLRLQIPQVLGDNPTGWSWGVFPTGVASIAPEVGSGVFVMFEGGDLFYPIWTGGFQPLTTGNPIVPNVASSSWGLFYDTTTLSLTSATTAYPLPLNSTAEAVGVSIVSGSRITVANAGVYNIQFSAQLDKTDGANDLVNIWFAKNGVNIDNSNTQVLVQGNNGKHIASWNFVLTLAANDYVQIMLQSPDTHMRVVASGTQTNPARPAVPSSIVTVAQVK